MADRVDFIPRHGSLDDSILPSDPLFQRLLTIAHSKYARKICVRDLNAGIEGTMGQLLGDTLKLRRTLKQSLPSQVVADLYQGNDVFICIFASGGYEFSVAILATLALGASAVLLGTAQPVEELSYYVNKTRAVALLAQSEHLKTGEILEHEVQKSSNKDFLTFAIASYQHWHSVSLPKILLSSGRQPDPNGPGIIIFTSGTTGPPKAVVLRRSTIMTGAQMLAAQLDLQPTDLLLHLLPVHHATGVCLSFFPFLQAGACIEFKPGGFTSQWVWDRWRAGSVTHFSGVPTIYTRLMRHFEENIQRLRPGEQEQYRNGCSDIKTMFCGTSALPRPVDDFWKQLRTGRRIVQRYGSTETQIVIAMPLDTSDNISIPDGSVGKSTIGTELKVAGFDNGDAEGELYVKSPNMFAGYLNDAKATRDSHDENGFYKTGDLVRRQGDDFFIIGRADIDILKSGGYKISALDIERAMLALPYLDEVMVVGVPDEEYGQRVAAVVTLRRNLQAQKDKQAKPSLDLNALRKDLRSKLAGYKLPTLLRVVNGKIPKHGTGKVMKKVLGPKYFPPDYAKDLEVQAWENTSQKTASKL